MLYGGLMLVILLLQVVFAFFCENPRYSADIVRVTRYLSGLCAYSAIGLFMSTLTSYQIVAAVGTLILTCLNFVGRTLVKDIPVVKGIPEWLSLSGRPYVTERKQYRAFF